MKTQTHHITRTTPAGGQRGATLFIALIALVAMSITGIALMRSGDTTNLIAGNIAFKQAAQQTNDIGVEAAITMLATLGTTQREANQTASHYYADYTSSTNQPSTARWAANAALTTDASTGNQYRYIIERVCSAPGVASSSTCSMNGLQPFYRVTSEVSGARGSMSLTQVLVSIGAGFTFGAAIITEEALDIPGNIQLPGALQNVHTNKNINISSTTHNIQTATYVISKSGAGCNPPCPGSPSGYMQLPDVVPTAFKNSGVDILLTQGGNIIVGGTTYAPLWPASGPRWKYTTQNPKEPIWMLEGSGNVLAELQGKTIYSEANIEIPGDIAGPGGAAWQVTLIAEGYIKISGKPNIKKNAANGLLIMAGTDIEFSGDPSTNIGDAVSRGVIAAGQQIKVNGNPNLNACILARGNPPVGGHPDDHTLVTINQFSGQSQIKCDGNQPTPWGNGAATRVSWRSVR